MWYKRLSILSLWILTILFASAGSVFADSPINRADFVTLVNRAFALSGEGASLSFPDVTEDDAYYKEVSAAKAVGYISGYPDGTFLPRETITREQAAAMMARLLALDLNNTDTDPAQPVDQDRLSDWSLPSVEAILAKGIMIGYPDKAFQPDRNITRGEATLTVERAKQAAGELTVYSRPGTYGPEHGSETVNGNVIISSADVTLQNITVTGNLLFAPGIGEGDGMLKNVTAQGNTVVNGGGPHSITLEHCNLASITVAKGGVRLQVESGTIDHIHIANNSATPTIVLSARSAIGTLTAHGPVQVQGDGTLGTANIHSDNVLIEPTPNRITVSPGILYEEGNPAAPPLSDDGSRSRRIRARSIALDPQYPTVIVGDTLQLAATFDPANTTNRSLAWQSNNEAVATVSPSGLLTAVEEGMAVITATGDGQKATTIVAVRRERGLPLLPGAAEGLFTYTVTDGKAEVTGYNAEGPKDVVIPDTLGGYPVTGIGPEAFYFKWIHSVMIPDGVTHIQYDAFCGNNLTTLDLPDSVTSIGFYAFGCNKLASVTLPEGVTDIGEYAFACNDLNAAILPDSAIRFGDTAFWENQDNDGDLTIYASEGSAAQAYAESKHYTFRSERIHYTYDVEGGEARIRGFRTDGPKDIVIPRKLDGYPVTSIGTEVFAFRDLHSVTLPYGLERVEYMAFAFSRIESVAIPCSVTHIGELAFADNRLETVTIPDSVTEIARESFARNMLSSVSIGAALTDLGEGAFAQNRLGSITLPDTLTGIGPEAFRDNQSRPEDFLIYGKQGSAVQTFAADSGHTFIPFGILFALSGGEAAITGYLAEGAKDVVIPDTIKGCPVTSIRSGAFRDKQLTSAVIPSGVTRIGFNAFDSNALTSVTLPAGLSRIEDYAFQNNQLTSVEISAGATHIGSHAFYENELTSVVIPSGVTHIDHFAFANNPLSSVTLPDTVEQIGFQSFYNNRSCQEDVILYASVDSVARTYAKYNHHTFLLPGDPTDFHYIVEDGQGHISNYRYDTVANAVIPETLGGYAITGIAGGAFREKRLTSVVIPAGITDIGDWAFYGNALTSVTIPESVTTFGYGVFLGNQPNRADLIIRGTPGSAAQAYAESNEHTFIAVE